MTREEFDAGVCGDWVVYVARTLLSEKVESKEDADKSVRATSKSTASSYSTGTHRSTWSCSACR